MSERVEDLVKREVKLYLDSQKTIHLTSLTSMEAEGPRVPIQCCCARMRETLLGHSPYGFVGLSLND